MNYQITKTMIDNALDFYCISNNEYKKKCYNCINELNKNQKRQEIINNIYKILFEDKEDKIRKLWSIKNNSELFGEITNPFITNVLLLSGYTTHKENIKKYKLDEEQIKIHKQRVKEALLSDIETRKYDGIRISQMLWGAYFINLRIIEVGRLQYEFIRFNPLNEKEYKKCIKIHIPRGERLDISKVKNSLYKSKSIINKYYKLEDPEYFCSSWLLSKQIRQVVSENSNIAKFYDLFNVIEKDYGIDDIMFFIYGLKECNNYKTLPENTSLQRKVKELLLNDIKINIGLGVLKEVEQQYEINK